MQALTSSEIETLLRAVGDLLAAEEEQVTIVIVGGASLNLLGLVQRTTIDVDVIALASPEPGSESENLVPPEPLPAVLERASLIVARDYHLPYDWMNTQIAAQWRQGLPPTLSDDITWRRYGALRVGLVGRKTLRTLKLFAAVDRGPRSVHYQDLVRLLPTDDELEVAADWVRTQDTSEHFPGFIER